MARRSLIAITVLAVFLSVFSAIRGFAAVLRLPAAYTIDRWECVGAIDDPRAWPDLQRLLVGAMLLAPDDADTVNDLGRLYEWQARNFPVWYPAAHDARAKAVGYYRDATERRPTWAAAWLNFAQSKILNGDLDEEALSALQNAWWLGRWQPEIEKRLVWLNIGLWPFISGQMQEETRSHIGIMLDRGRGFGLFVAAAVRFDWIPHLRELIKDPEQRAYLDRVAGQSKDAQYALVRRFVSKRSC